MIHAETVWLRAPMLSPIRPTIQDLQTPLNLEAFSLQASILNRYCNIFREREREREREIERERYNIDPES